MRREWTYIFVAYASKGLLASQMAAYAEKVDSRIEQRQTRGFFCISTSGGQKNDAWQCWNGIVRG